MGRLTSGSLVHPSVWMGLSQKFALRVELLLYHRLCWLSRGYGICVPMHYLPVTFLRPKDHRNPKSERGNVPLPPILAFTRSIHTV